MKDAHGFSTAFGSAAGGPNTVTLEQMTRALHDLDKKVGTNADWLLMSPHGQTWKGTVEQITLVLAANHPTYRQLFAAPDPANTTKFVNVGSPLDIKDLKP